MSRIQQCFAELGERTAFVSFITAGDPHPEATVPAMHALVAGGADVLELGVPFSDPEADGPAIQASSERALAQGVRFNDVLSMVEEFRKDDDTTPVVLMGYLNVLLRRSNLGEIAANAGVDGFIIVNLPPEEDLQLQRELADAGLDVIFLVAPTTTDERMGTIARAGRGFLYYVSFKGVTGADQLAADDVAANLARLRRHTKLPICVGFGIKDGTVAKAVGEHADGVVVGSAIVRTMADLAAEIDSIPEALRNQACEFREALDS